LLKIHTHSWRLILLQVPWCTEPQIIFLVLC
jgi:hypothetical protein